MQPKEKFHEKMVECYVFASLEAEGILTLFSGFEERYLGDALFSGGGKLILLEFKAISEGKSYAKACSDEKDKFVNLKDFLKNTKELKPAPHLLIIGKLTKKKLTFEGGNYISFLESCSPKALTSSSQEDLKNWLKKLIDLNSTDNFVNFLRYVILLVKSRLKQASSSGGESFQEEVRKLLTGVKVVVSVRGHLYASTLGNLIAAVPVLMQELSNLLGSYIKNLEQNVNLHNKIQENLRREIDDGPNFGPSL